MDDVRLPILLVPASQVLPWLAKMEAYGQRLHVALSVEGPDLGNPIHQWYLHLFRGFQKAFKSREVVHCPLNLNLVVPQVFARGLGEGLSSRQRQLAQVEGYLKAVAVARAIASGEVRHADEALS